MIILLSLLSHCLELTGLHREPVEGGVRPLRGPGGLVLLLLLWQPLGLHLSGQVCEERVPAPVVVRLNQGGLGFQTSRQHPAVSVVLSLHSAPHNILHTSSLFLPTLRKPHV